MADTKDITANLTKQEPPKSGVQLTDKWRNPAPTKQPEHTQKWDMSFPQAEGLVTAEHKKALVKPTEAK